MFQKKIAVALLLTLFFANCNSKKDDDSTTNLLLLAAVQSQKPDVSGVYAALSMLRGSNNNPGQQGAYSNGKVSPFSVASDQTKDCSLGGSMKMSLGNLTEGQGVNGSMILNYTGSKLIFQNCKENVPSAEKGGSSEVTTFNGEISRDGSLEAIIDMNSFDPNTGSFTYTMNSTQKMYSDTYSVNGSIYPKVDLTFKVSNGKYAASNMNDVDKATLSVEETVEVTGTIGEEKIKESYTTKYTINFK
ncbi:sigma factor SigX-regulated lipoprotein SrpC [Leptospira interrogans]|uniref:sigma factor SigX-regulated lipoprotein SrpC n=1 Tax=Leptospira interrogans TaxID=173 RepID=UPI0007732C4F